MAAKGAREAITLECTECKRRNYTTEKNKKNNTERLEVEKLRLEGEVARCEKMLSNPGFVNKAPEAKVKEEKEKLEKYKKMLEKVMESLN